LVVAVTVRPRVPKRSLKWRAGLEHEVPLWHTGDVGLIRTVP
jgi:hypothetical protein